MGDTIRQRNEARLQMFAGAALETHRGGGSRGILTKCNQMCALGALGRNRLWCCPSMVIRPLRFGL